MNAAAAGELEHWLGIASKLEAAAATARAECERLLGLLDALPASWRNLSDERNTATVRAERAEAKLAGQCETCGGEGVMYVGPVNGRGGEECVACGECLGTAKGWVAQAIAGKVTTERTRVVEAIAAWHDKASNIDSSHGNSGQAFAHALSADHIRSHNWAPPEEDGDE